MAEAYIDMGKPRLFQDAAKLQERIDAYFDDCRDRGAPYTITGLAVALETSRRLLLDIQKSDHYPNDFKEIVNLAKARVLQQTEEGMMSGSLNATGCIFTLKNNFNYVDKIEQVIDVKTDIAASLEDRRQRVINATALKLIDAKKENPAS